MGFSGFSDDLNKRLKLNLTEWQRDAFSIHELACDLVTISDDDNKEVIDYTLEEVLEEAMECLYMFTSKGTVQNEEYKGMHGEKTKEFVKLQMKQLRSFIKKY